MKSKKSIVALTLIVGLLLISCNAVTQAFTAPNANIPQQVLQVAQQVATPAIATPATSSSSTASSSTGALAELEAMFEQVYTKVNPSVVNIQVVISGSSGFGGQGGGAEGSGFVWDQQGHIVTNAHVVDSASSISVIFSDGTTVDAQLVGADRYSDLAVIKVNVSADKLHPVEMGDSSQVKVGQLAIAIGNPFGLQGTMTQGIISGLSRSLPVDVNNSLTQQGGRYSIPDIIQTDASINPGNSGGVLVDDQGKVIGVTAAIATSTQSNSGVGFVIPAGIVQKVVPSLISTGKVEHSWMGITGTTLTPDLVSAANLPAGQQGALVLSVTSGSPAEKAGVRGGSGQTTIDGRQVALGGDVITAIDGQPVTRFEDMVSYLFNKTDPGQTVTLTVLRDGKEQTLQLTLGTLPNPS